MYKTIIGTFDRFNHAVTIAPARLVGKNLPLLVLDSYDFFKPPMNSNLSFVVID